MTEITTDPLSRSPEPQEVLRVAIESFVRDVNVALPGKIEEYDPKEQKASVKPLVQRLTGTEEGEEFTESLPVIPGVPVIFPRGGGFFISMPVKKGDYCLLVFNSFPIDKYKSGNGVDASPEDFDMHELTDAVALMGFSPFKEAIEGADPECGVIGFEQGLKVYVAKDKLEIGQKDATEKLSIDSKVQAELQRANANAQAALDFANGVKTAISGGVPVPMDGGAGLLASQLAGMPVAPSLDSVQATNSTIVTIKE